MPNILNKFAKDQKNQPNGTNIIPAANISNPKNTYTGKNNRFAAATSGGNQFSRVNTAIYNGSATAERGITTSPGQSGIAPSAK